LPLLKRQYCDSITNHIENQIQMVKSKGTGLQASEFGMDEWVNELLKEYLVPIVKKVYPQYRNVTSFSDVYSKVVKYNINEDEDWPVHIDQSCVTINICIGRDFKGSNLRFHENKTSIQKNGSYYDYMHEVGRMVIHLGDCKHSITRLESGSRYSLIILLNKPL